MLNTAIRSLNNLEKIVPVVQESGRKHVSYGVNEEYYSKVAEALLWTLGQGLGEDSTDEERDAWSVVYVLLATTMKEAAAEVA